MDRPKLDRWLEESGEVLREYEDRKLAEEAARDEELGKWEEHDHPVPRPILDEIDWQIRHGTIE